MQCLDIPEKHIRRSIQHIARGFDFVMLFVMHAPCWQQHCSSNDWSKQATWRQPLVALWPNKFCATPRRRLEILTHTLWAPWRLLCQRYTQPHTAAEQCTAQNTRNMEHSIRIELLLNIVIRAARFIRAMACTPHFSTQWSDWWTTRSADSLAVLCGPHQTAAGHRTHYRLLSYTQAKSVHQHLLAPNGCQKKHPTLFFTSYKDADTRSLLKATL